MSKKIVEIIYAIGIIAMLGMIFLGAVLWALGYQPTNP